jgi:serine/threonine-protein kinase
LRHVDTDVYGSSLPRTVPSIVERLSQAVADRYRIEREIGAGGMATVYLAQDIRHDRPVALKVLNPELGAVLGVERFLAEIKVTANLQHPNLLPLFDSGEAGGLLFYVMPFVEGESLRGRLDREKQLPIDEAVRMAVAVANALDYAHQHHVIHRDLKPENILLQAGQPVVADFGIALAVSNAGGNRITQTGLSLGTPQYMSPEQATGDRAIDGRTDIYSLGAIVYEMLTGEPPHLGSTSQAIIARLLTERPHGVRTTRPVVPEYLEAAVAHALEKLPADRFSTAREFADAMQGRGTLAASPSHLTSGTTAAPATPPAGIRQRLRDPVFLGIAAVAVAASGALVVALRPAAVPPELPTIRYALATTDSTQPFQNYPWPAAISPDGGTVAYWVTQPSNQPILYVQRSDQLEGRPVPGTAGGFQPIFSPDGEWIAFQSSTKERKVRLDGSAPVTISDGGGANGADWTVKDELVLGAWGAFTGLSHVSTSGGSPVEFTRADTANGERQHVWPIAFPDGETVVFTIWSGTQASSRLAMATIGNDEVVPLELPGIRPLAVLDGHVVYVQSDGAIMAVEVDAGRKRVVGRPVPVHDPIPVVSALNGNSGAFLSRGGALVVSSGTGIGRLGWMVPRGTFEPLALEPRSFGEAVLSPDEKRLAIIVGDGMGSDAWIYDLGGRTLSRLTSSGGIYSVGWSQDGAEVIYTGPGDQTRSAVYRQAAGGGAPPTKLFEVNDLAPVVRMAPDGKSLLVTVYRATSWDLYRVPLDSGGDMRPFLTDRHQEMVGAFSPDGRWVAVQSDESGRFELYVRSYPDPSSRIQVSVEGGREPQWSRDGTRLYYRSGQSLMQARLSVGATVSVVGRDTLLEQLPGQSNFFANSYEVARDGRRILVLSIDVNNFRLVVSPNWITEFRRRIGRGPS